MNCQIIANYIRRLGASNCRFISPRLLVPQERIRNYCYEDKCGCYNKHLMCPPNTETIPEIVKKLKGFQTGILIQYSEDLDVHNDMAGLRETKLRLHHIVLETEKYLEEKIAFKNIWGMIGGACALCDECAGRRGDLCIYPDMARTSLEALAIDVVSLLEQLNLDAEFCKDRITWTGMILLEGA